MNKFWVFIFFCTSSFGVLAQDFQYTQFYAAPLYLNPALAGTTGQSRLVCNSRTQWMGFGINRAFNNFSFSYDTYAPKYKSGIGVIANYSSAGSGSLRTYDVGLIYSYLININNAWKILPAVELDYVNRGIDFNNLIFGDQISSSGIAPVSQERLDNLGSINYFDVASGFVLFNNNFWLGASGHHLNTPNQSLTGSFSTLPINFSVHGGYKIIFKENPVYAKSYEKHKQTTLTPTFNYRQQGTFQQLDIGMYLNVDPMVFGLWYRGIPIINTVDNVINSDAFAILVGLKWEKFNFGYSYDATVSQLGLNNTLGAHEISLAYLFDTKDYKKPKMDKRKMLLPCPQF